MAPRDNKERLRWIWEVGTFADARDVPLDREDLAWLYAVRRAEERIWNRLIELLAPHIMGRLTRALGTSLADLEGVAMETIVHHMLGRTRDGELVLAGYAGETGASFSAWLCTSAIRRGQRSHQRRARSWSAPPRQVDLADHHDERVPLAQLDGRVPADDPTVVPDLARATDAPLRPSLLRAICCRVAGLSMAETARVLGVSEPTARKKLTEVRRIMASMRPDAFTRVALRVERILLDADADTGPDAA